MVSVSGVNTKRLSRETSRRIKRKSFVAVSQRQGEGNGENAEVCCKYKMFYDQCPFAAVAVSMKHFRGSALTEDKYTLNSFESALNANIVAERYENTVVGQSSNSRAAPPRP